VVPFFNAEALVRKRILLLPVLVAAVLTLSAVAAQAAPFVLTLTDVTGGATTVITDQIAPAPGIPGDSNNKLDGILFIGKVGSFDVTIFGNTYTPGPSGAPVQMNISNFRVTSTTAGDFRATLQRTGLSAGLFTDPLVVGVATAGATLTAAGDVTFQSWVNGSTVFTPGANTISGGTLAGSSGPVALGGDLALQTVINFSFDGGGTMNANTDLQVRSAAVPEPTTLLLFGPGMLGLAAIRRRRRLKAVKP